MRALSTLGLLSAVALAASCLDAPRMAGKPGAARLEHATVPLKAALVKREEAGLVVASVDPTAKATQTVAPSAGSRLAGTLVAFPPGALALAADITVEEGAPVAQRVAAELGLKEDDVLASGEPVMVTSSVPMDATVPFSVSINLPTSLGLVQSAPATVAVFYRVTVAASGETLEGVIPSSEIALEGGKVVFSTRYFGVYQAVQVKREIVASQTFASQAPVVSKSVADAAPLVVSQVRPLVAPTGATVELRGKNLRPGVRLALGGRRLDGVDVKSDGALSFVVPDGVAFGFQDLVAEQDGVTQRLKLFAQVDRAGLPLITMSPDGVCAGTVYVDANGDRQTGTRDCGGGASAKVAEHAKSADRAAVASSAATATFASRAAHASTSTHAVTASYAQSAGSVSTAVYASSAAFASSAVSASTALTAATAGSAGSAEQAAYALGKGETIAFANPLPVPETASFFTVTGTGEVTQIATAPAGRRVAFRFAGTVALRHREAAPALVLKDGHDFTAWPGVVLEMMSTGSGWVELARSRNAEPRADLSLTPGGSVDGAGGVIKPDVVHALRHWVYDEVTGTFTAPVCGEYGISMSNIWFSHAQFNGGSCNDSSLYPYVEVYRVSPNPGRLGVLTPDTCAYGTGRMALYHNVYAPLAAGDQIQLRLRASAASNLEPEDMGVSTPVTIDPNGTGYVNFHRYSNTSSSTSTSVSSCAYP